MADEVQHVPKVLEIYLKLSEYPILAREIRAVMREQLFARGIISEEVFDSEVEATAIRSQKQEGLTDPLVQEPAHLWAERLNIIRDHLTDFYFALNLPYEVFEEAARSVLGTRKPGEDIILTFNPELAPWYLLFAQAEEFQKLGPLDKDKVRHHLQQISVVLIRGMISDQLEFVGVARKYFDTVDLRQIYGRRFGRGKIGGKSAGMMLAHKILLQPAPDDPVDFSQHVVIPESYFVGADLFYDFMAHNQLFRFSDQKYKDREQIEADYLGIREHFLQGEFPEYIVGDLRKLVERMGKNPLIVRSSSLLEDNFGKAFAGKYESCFCPNQGTAEENWVDLLNAIRCVYASTLNPDALFYRQQSGLVDYDERMAVLIQEVQGHHHGRYFLPTVAGVAFSHNPFRWTRRIRREEGFLRMVSGLGTRAVDRVANDYPRMVALSHPTLRPEVTAEEIRKYSQHFIDVIDLAENRFTTLPIKEVIDADFPSVELLASVDEGDYIRPMLYHGGSLSPADMVITFERLLKEQAFTSLLRAILRKLERAYKRPVDVEFTVEIVPEYPVPHFIVHLLQCRPLSRRRPEPSHTIPPYIPAEDVIFTSSKIVPEGIVTRIEYVIYVDPEAYAAVPSYEAKHQIARTIGRLNKKLEGYRFILVGPGRWGSSNIDLGVRVTYADIYNTSMLIEVAFAGPDGTPEVSYGTHFFQDLVEANIYPLPLYPDEAGTVFDRSFFRNTASRLADLLPDERALQNTVRVIHVPSVTGGRLLEVVMNSEEEKAIGYVRSYPAQVPSHSRGNA
ncbi:MAG TPA: PEP/pyruvate-binding domain-containing protein [Anaerolineae bacterium]|nr:PEP/pyruvate-binding domain-containing protein [Anaerolineae bacterium]